MLYSISAGMRQRAAADICTFTGAVHHRYSWDVLPAAPAVYWKRVKTSSAVMFAFHGDQTEHRPAACEPADSSVWFSQLSVSCRPVLPESAGHHVSSCPSHSPSFFYCWIQTLKPSGPENLAALLSVALSQNSSIASRLTQRLSVQFGCPPSHSWTRIPDMFQDDTQLYI